MTAVAQQQNRCPAVFDMQTPVVHHSEWIECQNYR